MIKVIDELRAEIQVLRQQVDTMKSVVESLRHELGHTFDDKNIAHMNQAGGRLGLAHSPRVPRDWDNAQAALAGLQPMMNPNSDYANQGYTNGR